MEGIEKYTAEIFSVSKHHHERLYCGLKCKEMIKTTRNKQMQLITVMKQQLSLILCCAITHVATNGWNQQINVE
jgi:hypothetical protein